MIRGKFQLVLHEILGNILMCRRTLLTKILKAYASQKFSMLKKCCGPTLYVAETVEKVNSSTNRSFINCVLISFESRLKAQDATAYVRTDDVDRLSVERECRRHVDSSHPLLVEKLGVSCNDFSNLTFLSREIEILHRDYRLVINPATDSYYIQYKKKLRVKTIFRPDLLTLEALYFSHEGRVFTDAVFVAAADHHLLGLASFLDSRDLAVKTVYWNENNTTLYQRICPDNYTKSYPFTLENEFPSDYQYENPQPQNVGSLFFRASWTLDARVPTLPGNGVVSPTSKPIHTVERFERATHRYSKFDGVPATLTFFSNHFVVTNSISSLSFEHSLSRPVVHILRDYFFLVESNLYVSEIPTGGPDKPRPMVIIDINTTVFDATERMEIIQALRKHLRHHLYDYYIFFQGEIRGEVTHTHRDRDEKLDASHLLHNSIYEVKLHRNLVTHVIKQRKDKLKPNSRKLINVINKLQS